MYYDPIFESIFPDDKACMDWLVKWLWPNGRYCHYYKDIRPLYLVKRGDRQLNWKSWVCYCGETVSPLAHTFIKQSNQPALLWFQLIYLMNNGATSRRALRPHLNINHDTLEKMRRKALKAWDTPFVQALIDALNQHLTKVG